MESSGRSSAMDNPSNSNSNIHTIVKAQIVFLLSTLTEDNFERNQLEIRTLSEQHGLNTYLHFIRRLIVHSQARLVSTAASSAFDASTSLTFRLLVQETQRLARDPFLADRFREGVDKGEGEMFRQFDLVRFTDRVGLRPLERLVLASAMSSGTSRKELRSQAATIIRIDFENAMSAFCQTPSFENGDLNPSQGAKLLANLLSEPPPDAPMLDAPQRQALITAAQVKYGAESVAPILQQLFPELSLPPGTSLVQVLMQLGPDITNDVDVLRALFTRFRITEDSPPRDAQVVDLFTTLGRLAVEGNILCDVGALVRAMSSYGSVSNWAKVIEAFDRVERHTVDPSTLKLVVAILLNSPRDAATHAVEGLWTKWSNTAYQMKLLDALLSLPSDTFNFVSLPGQRVITVDDMEAAGPAIKSLVANIQGQSWNTLQLFEVIVNAADVETPEVYAAIYEMLDKAIKNSAEIIHIGLVKVHHQPFNKIQVEFCQRLMSIFLGGHANYQLVLMRLLQIDHAYVTNALRDYYEENPLNITRILDVAQDLKVQEELLDMQPFIFALDIAALASRREYLNLERWLADKVAEHQADFVHAVISFLDIKAQNEKTARLSDPASESRSYTLSPQTIAIFLRTLRNSSAEMDERDVDYCLEVRNSCLQIYPRLMNLVPGSDQEPGFAVVSYGADIEAEVDTIYKKMYDEQISIDGVIATLQRLKDSTNPRDHEIFSCMLHFLFDEYKFFQAFYPPRELAMTGYLFGSLIQNQLIDYIPLGIAIRYVLDALQCPPDTNLFKFGIQALSRFDSRLPEWKPLCQALVEIPHIADVRPDIAETVRRVLLAGDGKNGTAGEDDLAFTAIQPDKLGDDFESPSEEVSDKILFIINNLAPSNFDAKMQEMKERFKDEYSRWLANYLVDERVSSEPNNHQLYIKLLDTLEAPKLAYMVLQETYVKSIAMLNADKTMQQPSERALLKNLASWLGQITLAKDKPIKHKNMSFKDFLLEGADSNRLILAIPFVCKILEASTSSKIFKPPNPWLLGVMGLLMELYHFAEIKLNQKFEIEVLCGSLELDPEKIEMTTIFRSRPLTDPLAVSNLPDYVQDIDSLPMGGYEQHVANETTVLPLSPADSQRAVGTHIEGILANLANLVVINHQLSHLATNVAFKEAVQLSVDRSVREIILPVVERSVTIAGISTRELVIKDFATEPSEDKMRKAAHLMAQKLAGSLALVTCKEPLKSNMASHVRQHLYESGFGEPQTLPDQLIQMLVQDNIDIACAAIEKAAMDRAVADVDEGLAASYEHRRRYREQRSGQSYWDSSALQTSFIATLPDPLRIKPNGLQAHQLRLYEDFGMDGKRRLNSRPSSTVSYARDVMTTPAYPSPSPMPENQRSAAGGYLSHAEAMEQFGLLLHELETYLTIVPFTSLVTLPNNHEIRLVIRRILSLAPESIERNRTPLAMSQKVVQYLYKTTTQLGREIYVALLEQLCQFYDDVAKEAITWLIYADDERKFNVPVTATLLRSRLIEVTQEDQQLAKFLFADPRPTLQDFAAGLIRACLTTDPPIATQNQFSFTIEILSQLVQAGKASELASRLIDDLAGVRRQPAIAPPVMDSVALPPVKNETDQLQAHLSKFFQQWVSIFQRSSSPEKSFIPYITQLTKNGVLKAEDVSSFFFRVCAESSAAHYSKCISTGDFSVAFQALDAMSRLIILIIKYHGDAAGANNDQAKVHYLRKILSIVVLVLASRHEEQGVAFQQKPFFRFFSSLLSDLHSIETQLGQTYFNLLIVISDTFSSLQPMYFPGFAFSWMTLISHRLYMPKLLMSENREGWSAFHKLLISLFKFLAPFLRAASMQLASRNLYRGTLRMLLVLLHDFPEFLSEYYFSLCDQIPPRCIQMRNIILSAFPPSIILPDPHSRSFKFDSDMGPIPPILSDCTFMLQSGDLQGHLEQFMMNRGSQASLSVLKEKLRLPSPSSTGEFYNLPLINAAVMFIGITSVAQAKARSGSPLFVPADPGVFVLSQLATSLDAEGQHHLLSAIVLHLRYPNAHTHWFSSLLLHLFLEVQDEHFREIITKVLLERFIVHRPHPWGAVVTFVELLRNQKYEFWNKDFIRVAPEVTLLLENVARSVFSS